MAEPKIIKETIIQVDHDTLENDDYGSLKFLDRQGNSYKISNKREHLFNVIQNNASVQLFWAKYMDKLYIADAKAVNAEDVPPPQPMPKVEHDDDNYLGAEADKRENKPMLDKRDIPDREKDIHRQVALKAGIEVACHGLITLHQIWAFSEKARKYLDMELTEQELYPPKETKKEG